MSEAIWLAGASRPQASKETPEDWLSGFLTEKWIKADWITSAHILISRKVKSAFGMDDPAVSLHLGMPHRTGRITSWGAVCREIRAGEQDLVLMVEKDTKGWNASLLASPAFFGKHNRIPPVELLETRTFNRWRVRRIRLRSGNTCKNTGWHLYLAAWERHCRMILSVGCRSASRTRPHGALPMAPSGR